MPCVMLNKRKNIRQKLAVSSDDSDVDGSEHAHESAIAALKAKRQPASRLLKKPPAAAFAAAAVSSLAAGDAPPDMPAHHQGVPASAGPPAAVAAKPLSIDAKPSVPVVKRQR